MEIGVLVGIAALGATGVVVVVLLFRRQKAPLPTTPPPRAWKSDTVTPVLMGPRNRAPERVARGFVVTQGALLALRMAEVDGEVTADEREAIRQFITMRVTNADDEMAARAVREAEDALANPAAVEAALDGLCALSSAEQRVVLVDLLVHVAHADGVVRDEEIAFMERVGLALGLPPDALSVQISGP